MADPVVPLQLAFRVGVTGTREIPAAAETAVRKGVADLLSGLRVAIERLAATPAIGGIYAMPQGRIVPFLRVVSPLAEGADRLVAEEALKLGYVLDAALPFEQAEYERDFPDTTAYFRALLAHAAGRVLVLDGGRGADEWRSYEAVGRHVVRNCDLLVAVWDPEVPAKGRGGTEDTIRFAVESGLPVWWIDASGRRSAALFQEPAHSNAPVEAPTENDAVARLEALVEALVVPPKPAAGTGRGLLDRLAATVKRLLRVEPDQLLAFLKERERRRSRLRLFDRLMHVAARGAPYRAAEGALARTGGEAERVGDEPWSRISKRARRLSAHWAVRSRTSRLLVVGLSALAALAVITGFVLETSAGGGGRPAIFVAAMSMLAVGWLSVAERVGRWRERWADYRLLAELARAQQALGWIGWRLPRPGPAPLLIRRERTWIDWYFETAVRASAMQPGSIGGARLAAIRARIDRLLVAGQAVHHFNRRTASEEASRTLGNIGHGCFVAAFSCVTAAFLAEGTVSAVLDLFALPIAATAAAALALRAFADLDAMAAESEELEAIVERIDARLRAVDPTRPLASQDLGVDLVPLITQLLGGDRERVRRS